MTDIAGVVGLSIHAAHVLVNYLAEVQSGPAERDHLKFQLADTARVLNNIKFAYDQSPYEVQVQCAEQHDEVFGERGTFQAYLQLLISLNEKVQEKGFSERVKRAFWSQKPQNSNDAVLLGTPELKQLLESITEELNEQKKLDRTSSITRRKLEVLDYTKQTQAAAQDTRTIADINAATIRSIADTLNEDRVRSLLDSLSKEDPWVKAREEYEKCDNSKPDWILETPVYNEWVSKTPSKQELWGVGENWMLLENENADLEARDLEGLTLLHTVWRHGAVAKLKLVLDRCSDSHLKEQDGLRRTALHHAATRRELEELEVLLDAYMQRYMHDVLFWRRKDGLPAKDVALASGWPAIYERLAKAEDEFGKSVSRVANVGGTWKEVHSES
ncbi:hypothetical protein NA57DRAFT_57612 [Rhizodiscina lignyota]|uniref:Uncharacterized protein n=1 Tax=Rhizodiscina lignyota TaxID=1504668 RepID=A0A9P4M756_9PEZI|nr:hypothetical protein NA57DRAFT_57612 [Rhizodiscina lignyota]